MRAPRFRIGTLMLVIAVVALPMAVAATLQRRSRLFQEMAAQHQQAVVNLQKEADISDLEVYLFTTPAQGDPRPPDELAVRFTEFIGYHYGMTAKYEHAALRPWRPVETDTPCPVNISARELREYLDRLYVRLGEKPGVLRASSLEAHR